MCEYLCLGDFFKTSFIIYEEVRKICSTCFQFRMNAPFYKSFIAALNLFHSYCHSVICVPLAATTEEILAQ